MLSHHSTPVRWGRMATWPYCYCWPPLPLKPEELWWHSCMLLLRGMMLSLEALGPRLSIGITIEVTPFLCFGYVAAFLPTEGISFLILLSSLCRERSSHGSGVISLT